MPHQFTVDGLWSLYAVCNVFQPDVTVPDKWEQSSPSLHQALGQRGLPGVGKGWGIGGKKRVCLEHVIEKQDCKPLENCWPLR